MINHEELLKKYIRLVCDCEGISYVSEAGEWCGFTSEEIEELERLEELADEE